MELFLHRFIISPLLTVEATNLFLRTNGHEVLDVMMPQLKVKLVAIFTGIINRLLNNVPSNMFYIRTNSVH